MPLPAIVLRTDEPGIYDFKIFVGGNGQSWERHFQLKYDTPLIPLPLTGYTIQGEVRSLDDVTQLALMTTTAVDLSIGKFKLTMTKTVCDAIAWPPFGAPIGEAIKRARWNLSVDDGTNRVVFLRGAVEVLR